MTEMYSPGEVQKLLGMDGNTLRRYASLLEGHGYHIHRNHRGHRGYFDKDVDMLRKLMEFSKQDGMTVELSVEAVMMWVSEEYKSDLVTEEEPEQNTMDSIAEEGYLENTADSVAEEIPFQNVNDLDINHDCSDNELLKRIKHLEQINLELIQLLKEKAVQEASQEQKINQILNHVEYTAQLTSERSQLDDARMQIAAASQKKWWKWW